MLSASYLVGTKELKIQFDTPAPEEIWEHGEVSEFLQLIGENGNNLFHDSQGNLLGFRTSLEKWTAVSRGLLEDRDFACHNAILTRLAQEESSQQGEGLQVNFHQKSFDTPDRLWRYFVNQGHFVANLYNRINWYIAPRYKVVTPFPLHVDVESASTCNMNCPMCYRRGLKETGQMEFDLFQRIVEECSEQGVFSIRLSWRGETLSHPRITEMISYAANRIRNVSFLTNAFYLTDDIVDCLIENQVSYISVSFDGIGKVYESIRAPAKFEENYRRLKNLAEKREAAGKLRPQVRVCTIWPAIRDDPDGYYRAMSEVSDYVVCNPYINFMGPMKIKPDFICQYPWERIVVAYNGDAQCCTGWNAESIVLGNVRDRTIREMWHSDRMEEIRRIHSQGRRLDIEACANCRHGSKGDPDITIEQILQRRF